MTKARIIVAAASVLVLGVGGLVIVDRMTSAKPSLAETAEPATEFAAVQSQVHPVEVVHPVRRSLTRTLKTPASLTPYEAADLYAKVSGYVSSVWVDIGDRVRVGDRLVQIDVPEMGDELNQAEALLDSRAAKLDALKAAVFEASLAIEGAEAEVKRAQGEAELQRLTTQRKEELYAAQAISDQEVDEAKSRLAIAETMIRIEQTDASRARSVRVTAEANVKVGAAEVAIARASVARLRTLMEYATLEAPFDGVITRRHVDPGAFVRSASDGATSPILHIANSSRIRIVLDIPEPDAPFVVVGTAVRIIVPALGGQPIDAAISRTAYALEPDTRTMRAEIDLPNDDGLLQPGMYATAHVTVEVKPAALMVPSKAIRARGGETFVLVARDGEAAEATVTVGYDDGIWAEILDGLDTEAQVITTATSAVAPGVRVRPMRSNPSDNESRG